MYQEQSMDFGTFMLYLFCFIVSVFIIRWIFRIDRILGNLDKQYEITKLIAYKLGVENIDIKKVDDIEEYKKLLKAQHEEEEIK